MIYFDKNSVRANINDVDCFVHILYVTPPYIIFSMWAFLFFILFHPASSFVAVLIVLLFARFSKMKEISGVPLEYSKKVLELKKNKILKKNFKKISFIRVIGDGHD